MLISKTNSIIKTFCSRSLNDVVNLKKLEKLPTAQIKEIWHKYHTDSESKCVSTLSLAQHEKIIRNSKIDSFYTLYSEFQDNYCIMTSLECYKAEKGSSYPFYVVSFYDELLDSRDVSLVRGEVMNQQVSMEDAKSVLKRLIEYYTDDGKFQWVETFNKNPSDFDVNSYFYSFGVDLNSK